MIKLLTLRPIKAYTVLSSDNERSSSKKGIYSSFATASASAKASGWYGSDGTVLDVEAYIDSNGEVYTLNKLGKFTDAIEDFKKTTLDSIKSKLTKEELEFLKLK